MSTASGAYIFGNVNFVTGMTFTASANVLNLEPRSSKTLAMGSLTMDKPLTITAVGGTVTLNGNIAIGSTRTFTLVQGNFDASSYNVSAGLFSSNNSNTRTLTMGSGTWTLTGNNSTIWTTSTTTGLTLNPGTAVVDCAYSGATGTRTITTGALTEAQAINFNISAGTDALTLSAGDVFKNLNFTGYAGTLANNSRTVYGNLTIASGMTLTAGSNTLTMGATSGTKTITTNGKTLDFPITINAPGGTIQLADALTGGATRLFTLTAGTFDINGKALSIGQFSSSNSNARTFADVATGGSITVTGNAATVWTTSTTTNLTITTLPTITFNYSGATGTRTITGGSGAASAQCFNANITAGTDIVSLSNNWNAVDLNGFTGTLSNSTRGFYNSFNFRAGITYTAGGNATSFINTSGTITITSNGQTLDFPITCNNAGTVQLADSLTIGATRTFTLTAGIFDINGKALSIGLFSSSNSTTREFKDGLGGGTITITGNAATIYTTQTDTNLTLTGLPTITFNYNGATGTRSIYGGSVEATSPNIAVTAGTDIVSFFNGFSNVNMTGWAGVYSSAFGLNCYGNFNIPAATTFTGAGTRTSFRPSSGTKTITTNGATFNAPITVEPTGTAIVQLADALTMGSTRTLDLTAGTLDLNSVAVSVGFFQATASGTRVLTFGSTTLTLTGVGTVFNVLNTAGLTINEGTGSIDINAATASARYIQSTGSSFPLLMPIKISAGTGQFTFYNIVCTNLDFTGYSGQVQLTSYNIEIRGNLTLGAGMTFQAGWYTIIMAATSGTKIITSNGATISRPLVIDASGATIQLADALTIASDRYLYLTNGTLDTNNQAVSLGKFATQTGTQTLTLGSSVVTITESAGATAWDCSISAGFTLNADTSLIRFASAYNCGFQGGGKTYYDVEFAATRTSLQSSSIDDGNTFHDLKFYSVSGSYGSKRLYVYADLATVTGTLTIVGLDAGVNRAIVYGNATTLSRAHIDAAAISLTDVNFQNIDADGAAIDWTGTRLGNLGNNLNITFAAPSTKYWVGDGGDWYDPTNHWAASSGGAAGNNNLPLPQDSVRFDANSFTIGSQVVTTSDDVYVEDVDWTGVTNTPDLNNTGGWTFYITGDLTFVAAMTYTDSNGYLYFVGGGTHNITTNGLILSCYELGLGANGDGDTCVLQDDLEMASQSYLYFYDGTFNANNKNLIIGHADFTSWYNSITINMGSGTWTIIGDDDWDWTWHVHDDVEVTLNADTSEIIILGNTPFLRNFQPGYYTYNKITYNQTDVDASLFFHNHNDNSPGNLIKTFKVTAGVGAPAVVIWDDTELSPSSEDKMIFNFTNVNWNGIDGTDNIVFDSYYNSVSGIWLLNVANPSASYVAVANSNATYGNPIDDSTGGVNNDGNTYWLFVPPKILSEAVVVADIATKQVGRMLADALLIADVVVRQTGRVFAEAIIVADLLRKQSLKIFGEALAVTDFLIRQPQKFIKEIILVADAVIRQISRTFSEAVAVVDAFLKRTMRTFAESVVVTDIVQLLKILVRDLGESIAVADSLIRRTGRTLIDAVAIADSFVRLISIQRTFQEIMIVADSVAKQAVRKFSEIVAVADSISRQAQKTINQAIAIADSFTRSISIQKIFTEMVSIADGLTVQKYIQKLLQEVVVIADSIRKTAIRIFAEIIAVADAIRRQAAKTLIDAVTVTDLAKKSLAKVFKEQVLIASQIVKIPGKIAKETVRIVDSSAKRNARIFMQTISIAESFAKLHIKRISLGEIVSIVDSIGRVIARTFTEVFRITAGFINKLIPPPLIKIAIQFSTAKIGVLFMSSRQNVELKSVKKEVELKGVQKDINL